MAYPAYCPNQVVNSRICVATLSKKELKEIDWFGNKMELLATDHLRVTMICIREIFLLLDGLLILLI